MGKIVLEFDSVEESEEAKTALDASAWKSVIWELDQELRSVIKYEKSIVTNGKASLTEIELADKLRIFIRDTLNNFKLNLD